MFVQGCWLRELPSKNKKTKEEVGLLCLGLYEFGGNGNPPRRKGWNFQSFGFQRDTEQRESDGVRTCEAKIEGWEAGGCSIFGPQGNYTEVGCGSFRE